MKKPIHPAFPVTEIASLGHLMAIALAMEREAAERFDELADRLERQGNPQTAALFRELAADERTHEDEITRWAANEDRAVPAGMAFQWRMPEAFSIEETGSSGYTLTPYRALSVAVRNEERTFAFYSYLAAIAENDAVRTRAEALAKGELEHIAVLRKRRRLAYHAERRPGTPRRHRAASITELREIVGGLERGSAQLDTMLAQALEAAGEIAAATVMRDLAAKAQAAADEAATALDAAVEAPATQAAEAARETGLLKSGTLAPLEALRLALKNAEEVAQTYMDIAESARRPEVLEEAQRLSERAVARLAVISAQLQAQSAGPVAPEQPGAK